MASTSSSVSKEKSTALGAGGGSRTSMIRVGVTIQFRARSLSVRGKAPTIQFSISESGDRADIDIDYHSSHFPAALFNGHLITLVVAALADSNAH